MTQKKRSIVLGGACLLAFVVPACSSDDNSDSTVLQRHLRPRTRQRRAIRHRQIRRPE